MYVCGDDRRVMLQISRRWENWDDNVKHLCKVLKVKFDAGRDVYEIDCCACGDRLIPTAIYEELDAFQVEAFAERCKEAGLGGQVIMCQCKFMLALALFAFPNLLCFCFLP